MQVISVSYSPSCQVVHTTAALLQVLFVYPQPRRHNMSFRMLESYTEHSVSGTSATLSNSFRYVSIHILTTLISHQQSNSANPPSIIHHWQVATRNRLTSTPSFRPVLSHSKYTSPFLHCVSFVPSPSDLHQPAHPPHPPRSMQHLASRMEHVARTSYQRGSIHSPFTIHR